MKSNKTIGMFTVSIVAASGLYFGVIVDSNKPIDASASLVSQQNEQTLATADSGQINTVTNRIAIKHLSQDNGNLLSDQQVSEAVEVFDKGYKNLFEINSHINRNVVQNDILTDLANNDEVVELAGKIAGDPATAMVLYGEKQAEARVAAIMLLNHLAEEGDNKSLEKAIAATGERMNTSKWEKGVEHDYSDMISGYTKAYFKVYGADAFVNNFSSVLSLAHHSDRTTQEFIIGLELSQNLRGLPKEQIQVIRDKIKEHLNVL